MYRARLIIFLTTALFLFFICPVLQAQEKFSSIECDMVVESPLTGVSKGKFYLKDNKSRLEMDIISQDNPQDNMKMVTLYAPQKSYIYYPSQNLAMVIPTEQARQQMPNVPKDLEALNKKIVGQETLEGHLCDIYEFSNPGSVESKVWMARDLGFPLKSITAGTTMYYKNVAVDPVLDNSLFELPQGTKVQDLISPMLNLNTENLKGLLDVN